MLPANPTSQSLWGPQCPRALTAVAEEAGGVARGWEGRPTFSCIYTLHSKALSFPVSWVFLFVCCPFLGIFFKRQDIFWLTAPSAWTDVSKDAETRTFTPDADSSRPGPAEFSVLLPALQNHRIKVVTNLIFLDFSSPTLRMPQTEGILCLTHVLEIITVGPPPLLHSCAGAWPGELNGQPDQRHGSCPEDTQPQHQSTDSAGCLMGLSFFFFFSVLGLC